MKTTKSGDQLKFECQISILFELIMHNLKDKHTNFIQTISPISKYNLVVTVLVLFVIENLIISKTFVLWQLEH